jgi:hypothetical protein
MTRRIFGLQLGLRVFNWADVVVFLSLVGLLVILAWLGHSLWAPFTPDIPRRSTTERTEVSRNRRCQAGSEAPTCSLWYRSA